MWSKFRLTRFAFVITLFFLTTSCGGGGGGGGNGGDDDNGGPSSTFTFKAGWDNVGIVIDNQSLADVTVVRLVGGQYRLYADSYISGAANHTFLSYLSNDGLQFEKEPDNRWQGMGYDPFVLEFPGGIFRLYYNLTGPRQNQAVVSATSTDGLTFIAETGDRLTYNGRTEEANAIRCSTIVRLPSGDYRMYYIGTDNTGYQRLLSALSNDGIFFNRETGVRLDPQRDVDPASNGLGNAAVFLDSGGIWHMFMAVIKSNIHGIYHFTSSDGLSFMIDPVPVVQSYWVSSTVPVIAEDPAVVLTDNGLQMYWMPYRGHPEFGPETGVTAVWSCLNSSLK